MSRLGREFSEKASRTELLNPAPVPTAIELGLWSSPAPNLNPNRSEISAFRVRVRLGLRFMGSCLFLSDLHSAHEPGRASPSWRAARRAWNTSDSARWGQARPGKFMGRRKAAFGANAAGSETSEADSARQPRPAFNQAQATAQRRKAGALRGFIPEFGFAPR